MAEQSNVYAENCHAMIRINKAMVEETEEKIRLAPSGSPELERLQMELDGWVKWVERWETWLEEAENWPTDPEEDAN